MEALTSELTKKPFKNWKTLFQPFLKENVASQAKKSEDGFSCFLMGFYHEEGLFAPQDYQAALEYYRLGANKRDPFCLYKLYEIHSAKNFFGIEPDKETAWLYLIWSVLYLFAICGSFMSMDLDLELQTYYKNVLKQDKALVYELIDQFEDDIFGHDKELIKCVFDFTIEYISPKEQFNAQEKYDKMIDELIMLAEKGDPNFPCLFLFKSVLWDFQNVSNRNHKKVMNIIYKKNGTPFIYQTLKWSLDYLNVIHEKHPFFTKFLRFDGIEIFWQIKYNSSAEWSDKNKACLYVAQSLYNHVSLIENNVTKFISMDLMAQCYESGIGTEEDRRKALEIIESSRNFTGFVEEDFPYLRVGRLYEKLGDSIMSEKCYEKYINYSHKKRDLPIKFFRQGRYYEWYKKDYEKAIELYMKGISPPTEFYTFQLEIYAKKCRKRIWKLIRSQQSLYDQFHVQLEERGFFS